MSHHAAGGNPGGIRQGYRPGALPDAVPGIAPTTTSTTEVPTVPDLTNTHDDPSRYGCDPRHYLPPDLPDSWDLIATWQPFEPEGWTGALRVVLVYRRNRDDHATLLVAPSGAMSAGHYDMGPFEAWGDFSERSGREARRVVAR